MRDTERKAKILEREKISKLKVWEKTTSSAQVAISVRASDLMDGIGGDIDPGPTAKRSQLVDAAKTFLGGIKSHENRQPEKENMVEFIAKKREVFLVQVSIILHRVFN